MTATPSNPLRPEAISWASVRGTSQREGQAGIGVGLAGAYAFNRVLGTLLFDVQPRDSLTFATVAGLLAAVALAACLVPARRASLVDPIVALRDD